MNTSTTTLHNLKATPKSLSIRNQNEWGGNAKESNLIIKIIKFRSGPNSSPKVHSWDIYYFGHITSQPGSPTRRYTQEQNSTS